MGSILGACRQLSLRRGLLRLLLLLLLRLVAVELVARDAGGLCLRWSGGRLRVRLDYFEWARLAKLFAFTVLVEDFQIDDNEDTTKRSETVARGL